MTLIKEYEQIFNKDEQVYVFACFLPPVKTTILIKPSNQIFNSFSYETFYIFPRLKNIKIETKSVKKVEVKKEFVKEQSVFAEYKGENK